MGQTPLRGDVAWTQYVLMVLREACHCGNHRRALQLGFSDTPNFTRAFRRVMGVTPGEYQRKAWGNL